MDRSSLKTKWSRFNAKAKSGSLRPVYLSPDWSHVCQVAGYWSATGKPQLIVYANATGHRVFSAANCDRLTTEGMQAALNQITAKCQVRENLLKKADSVEELLTLVEPDFGHFWAWDVRPKFSNKQKQHGGSMNRNLIWLHVDEAGRPLRPQPLREALRVMGVVVGCLFVTVLSLVLCRPSFVVGGLRWCSKIYLNGLVAPAPTSTKTPETQRLRLEFVAPKVTGLRLKALTASETRQQADRQSSGPENGRMDLQRETSPDRA